MKYFWQIIFVIIFLISIDNGTAQHRWQMQREGGERPERLEKFRKMRLIEVLKLNEEESVRFFAKQTVHEDKVRDLMKIRDDILDDLEKIIMDNGDSKEIVKLSDKIKSIDQDIFSERQRYQDEVQKFLSPIQFGKFLIFERDFGRQIREAMQEMRQGRQFPPGKDE